MEPNMSSPSLFELQIDTVANAHLSSTAKWAKFISIVGFVMSALFVLVAIFAKSFFSSILAGGYINSSVFTVTYLIIALLFFLPNLFLFNYSSKMLHALAGNDQESLAGSFAQLKAYFKFIGILMIICIAMYALAFLLGIMGAIMR